MTNFERHALRFHDGLIRILITAGIFAAILVGWLASAPDSTAHGYIIRSIPASRSVSERPPARIQAWFSEGLEARFSALTLKDQDGNEIPLADVGVRTENTSILSGRIPETLKNGAYLLNMRVAFASDGHVYNEVLVFWVGEQNSAFATADQTDRSADPLEVIWRSVSVPGMNVLFGALLVYQIVLLPGWGNRNYKAGHLSVRVMNRLQLIIWIALIVALGGTIVAVLQQSMALFFAPLTVVLRDRLWSVVLDGTQVGNLLKLRLIFLGFAALSQAAVIYFTPRYPEAVRPIMGVNILNAGAALFTLSMTSHAAGATLWSIPSVFNDWLHLVANSAWVGGLVTLAFLLPVAIRPYRDESRQAEARLATLSVLRRFSVIAVICVALLIATGIYSTSVQVLDTSQLIGTRYGVSLLAKLVLVIPLLLLGLYHHLLVHPDQKTAISRLIARTPALNIPSRMAERLAPAFSRIFGTLRLESLTGIIVLIAAGYLAATPPPVPADARAVLELPSQVTIINGLEVRLAVDPNAAGENSYEVTLRRDGQPMDNATVMLRWGYPALDQRDVAVQLEGSGAGAYLSAGAELERGGAWWAVLDIQETGSTSPIRAALNWNVFAERAQINTRNAALINWLSAGAVLAVLGIWLVPAVAYGIQGMGWRRDTVLLSGLVTMLAVVFMTGGIVLINRSTDRITALRNPPPQVINPTLPDSDSLARGAPIFDNQCMTCHTPGSEGQLPRARIDFLRDEELYGVIVHGKNDIPLISLTDAQRWDLVNYLRSSVGK